MTQALDNPRGGGRHLQAVGGRIPPHDLDAEESLLGAMLLSRDAIAAALELTGVEDFYKPAHSHIFSAVAQLYARGEPADPVTVADELRRTGLMDAVGDPSVLISLQLNTPSTANASHYARIVEEHALLRRLVGVAGEIAELGFSVPEDVSEVIDRAETLVFEVAQRRVVDTMSPLRDLLAASLDHLEHLYARGDSVTGVPTGYTDLDERLAGLQNSNLVVIGARPSMGKALALDTPVPTPAGWSTMGELEVGDEVFDDRGARCTVQYVSPVFLGSSCFELVLDDGEVIVADAEHRWAVAATGAGGAGRAVVTTREMADAGQRAADGSPRWLVPVAHALDAPEAALPVDAYVLGWWLADGAAVESHRATGAGALAGELETRGYVVTARCARQWARVTLRGSGDWRSAPAGAAAPLAVSGAGASAHGTSRILTRELEEAGLLRGPRKLVPAPYLRASFKQRLELLQGLMDGAGSAADDGHVTLQLTSHALAEQVRELVCSLGHVPSALLHRSGRRADGTISDAWVLRWTPPEPVFRVSDPGHAGRAPAIPHPRAVVSLRPVPSVPVRCISVSSASELFLAGRSMVPTHNTSLALGIVSHAAIRTRTPVLLFSLEMSHLELTQRLLCSEAKVDSDRMRTGRLLESDWPKISDAIGRLGDAPIYIDDNPNVTVMDIRAKARRLKAREGLGLVVVDYLQLMSGHSRRVENRQVEVSEISRGLKVLARELDIPVIALSQLSRNLEMRQDKRPVLADLRESGCLTADTRITRADTGAEVTMAELLDSGERDIPVWALDEQLRLVRATMTHVFASGTKRVFELQMRSGRRLRGSANHPFRTILGWRPLESLSPGDRLATARALPQPSRSVEVSELQVMNMARHLGEAHGDDVSVPAEVASLPNRQLAVLLRQLWQMHGSLHWNGRSQVCSCYATSSAKVAAGVQALLLRFGIVSRIRENHRRGHRTLHRVHVDDPGRQLRFLDPDVELGVASGHGDTPGLDLSGLTGSLATAVAAPAAAPALVPDAQASPAEQVTPVNDVWWDEIVAIEEIGDELVYDATVLEHHNFLANGIVAHNSIEQDADVVMFIYRDDVYNPESEDRGKAEIIIAKHRNGPTGHAYLAFVDHYARFANMARV
ncbi:MAG: replicative DNA helicase [Acidimicrobiales bacterium]